MDRRTFLGHAAAAAALPGLANAEQKRRKNDSRFEIALSQYSLRALFRSGSLKPEDFPIYTVDTFGIKAIDLWEGGLPKEKLDDDQYLGLLRTRAEKAGTDLFLLMTGALDCTPAKRAASLDAILQSLGRAQRLECDFLRIFLKAPGSDEDAGVATSIETLAPLLDAAAKTDVKIAIEPGSCALSARGAFLARVAKQIDHEALTLMPDFGKLKNNVYAGTKAMLPHTSTISCKMHSFDDKGNQPDFDYERLVSMIVDSDYSGYLAIEWEGRRLQPVEGVKASQLLILNSIAAVIG